LRFAPANIRFIVWVSAAALALRLLFLGHQSLWVDELLTLIVATPKPGYPILQLLAHNVHGPLYTAVVFVFRSISENDFWLRLPSALAGAAAVPLVYLWVRRWIGENVGRYTAILLAVNPLHLRYSQELRGYAFVFFFGVLACYLLERSLGRSRDDASAAQGWRLPVLYAAAVAGAALSSFTAAFLYACHTVIWFLRGGLRPRRWLRWALIAVVILVLVSPWVYRLSTYIDLGRLATPVAPGQLTTDDRLRGETTFTPAVIPYAFYTYGAGFTLGPSLRELHSDASLGTVLRNHAAVIAWVALLFGGLALMGFVRALRGRMRWVEMLVYLTLPIVLTLALNWQNAKAFNVRYVMLGLPVYLALISIALDAARPRTRALLAAALLVTSVVSLGNHFFNGEYARADVRAAVRHIEEQSGAVDTDPGTMCIVAPTVFHVVQHYYGGDAPVHPVFAAGVPRESVNRQLDSVFAACNGVWYVRARPWVDDPEGAIADAFLQRYTLVETTRFHGVELMRLAP
jgi:uncharacterized membrane protein